jgi:hypothetical protein
MPPRKDIPLDEITKLFDRPIDAAASTLGTCTSVLKRICRSVGAASFRRASLVTDAATEGMTRWPYQQLRFLDKRIAQMKKNQLLFNDPPHDDVCRLLERRKRILRGLWTGTHWVYLICLC